MIRRSKAMTRWRASAIHLGLSALVIGAVFLAVLALWYPPALLPMSGVLGLITLIAFVDVCLGPLLTLVVYKPGKPSLKFDLIVIVTIQLAMLGYGLHTLALNRPVFMVGTADRLTLVRAFEIEADDLAAASSKYRRLSWTGPVWVAARVPTDPQQRSQLLADGLAGRDIFVQPKFFTEFDQIRPELLIHARQAADLAERLNADERGRLEAASGDRSLNEMRYLIINSSRGAAMILVDREGQLGNMVAIDPFEVRARPDVDPATSHPAPGSQRNWSAQRAFAS